MLISVILRLQAIDFRGHALHERCGGFKLSFQCRLARLLSHLRSKLTLEFIRLGHQLGDPFIIRAGLLGRLCVKLTLELIRLGH